MKTKFYIILSLVFLLPFALKAQTITNQNYNVQSGNGNGLKFWSSNNYKIHMGNTSNYRYGPVQDYSIKMNMNNDSDRGWTWGIYNQTPIAALSTQGTMQIKKDFHALGKIGIGTATPYAQLEIYRSEENPKMRFTHVVVNNPAQGAYVNGYYAWDIMQYKGSLHFRSGGNYNNTNPNPSTTTKFQITSEGVYAEKFMDISNGLNYYLDPANTSISLKVAGKIEAEEIEIKEMASNIIHSNDIKTKNLIVEIDNVADYVFYEDYELKTLIEVDKFIKENKHLPGIPAGKELEKNGMNIAEMNNLLLEKIEELTLYLIAMRKENNEIRAIINEINY